MLKSRRLTNSDRRELEVIFEENKDILFNIARKILGEDHLAEDAVHETILSAAEHLDKLRGLECIQIRKYLIIVVRNTSFRMYNKRKREVVSDGIPSAAVDISDLVLDIEDKDAQERVYRHIESLDLKYSDVLKLKYYYDFKDREIAKTLGISLENVKIRLVRGKAKIKELLEEDAHDRTTV